MKKKFKQRNGRRRKLKKQKGRGLFSKNPAYGFGNAYVNLLKRILNM